MVENFKLFFSIGMYIQLTYLVIIVHAAQYSIKTYHARIAPIDIGGDILASTVSSGRRVLVNNWLSFQDSEA